LGYSFKRIGKPKNITNKLGVVAPTPVGSNLENE
jgi:hypothetical protein